MTAADCDGTENPTSVKKCYAVEKIAVFYEYLSG